MGISTPLKWHGGKHYLAKRVVAMMPSHLHYVEPFAVGLSVLLAKQTEGSEVVNDLDGQLINFFRAIRDRERFPEFLRRVFSLLLARWEWEDAV